MRKVYCKDCSKVLGESAYYQKSIRCMSCAKKFLLKIPQDNPHWEGGSANYYWQKTRAIYYEHHTNIICEHCGSNFNICIHHKDKNYKNNNLDNLQALCRSCHSRHHRLHRKTKTNV